MKSVKQIEEYIKSCFDLYNIDYLTYFGFVDKEGEYKDIPYDVNDQWLNQIVKRASEILGISEKDIIRKSEKAQDKWYEKYPYVGYIRPFAQSIKKSFCEQESYDNLRMFEVIFDTEVKKPWRYDKGAIVNRMVNKLREINKSIPGTFHENADIEHLSISTETFCHFEEITKMTRSYIEMVRRVQELFLKAIDINLSVEEINEYNFLVTVLGFNDGVCRVKRVYYDDVVQLRDVYKLHKNERVFDYMILDWRLSFEPWRCTEFVENRELVQDFADVIPWCKDEMRKFAMKIPNFKIDFCWSDAKCNLKDYEVCEYSSDRRTEYDINSETIYIEKTDEEIQDDSGYVDLIMKLVSAKPLGGITSTPCKSINFLTENINHGDDVLFKRTRTLRDINFVSIYEKKHFTALDFDKMIGFVGGNYE